MPGAPDDDGAAVQRQAAYLADATTARLAAAGFAMLPPAPAAAGSMIHAPYALLPSHVPRSAFEAAVRLAQPFNVLVDAIARDTAWLRDTLARCAVRVHTRPLQPSRPRRARGHPPRCICQ